MDDYLAALMLGGASAPRIETVDLATLKTMNSFVFPNRFPISIAATLGLLRIYMTDGQNDVVVVINGLNGAILATVPILGPQGCVLSADERTLYVVGGTPGFSKIIVHAIDTTAYTVTSSPTLPLSLFAWHRLALSPDEKQIAIASINSAPALEILDATSLTVSKHIPFPSDSVPQHTMFVGNDRVLVWDTVADRLYQVDVPSGTIISGASIQLPADVSMHNGECTAYSAPAGRACIVKSQPGPGLTWALASVDPITTAVDTYAGFSGAPSPLCLSTGGHMALIGIERHTFAASPTLTTLDITGKVIAQDVFTFAAPPDMFPSWMVVVPRPEDLSRRIRGTALLTQILAGVMDDAPGVVVPPGGGPTPWPPWGGRWRDLSPAVRDVLLGVALHELAGLATASNERAVIQNSALALARGGLTRL